MENFNTGTYDMYKDISARTNGEIYIGVILSLIHISFQSTMNTKQMESDLQMLSKELTLITTNRSGIYTQQILLAKALC